MNDITMQQIEIFLSVAEQLNLSDAAKSLFLNQSAVSRCVQKLEASLNTKLFRRTNRGVELTERGELLYTELKPFYDKVRMTLQDIRSAGNLKDNILRVGCLDSTEVIRTLKSSSMAFDLEHPDTFVKIELYNFKDLREKILCGELDCIISYSLGFGEYRGVLTKKIKKLNTYIAVSAHGPLAGFKELPTHLLGGETLYLLYIAEMKDAEKRMLETCRSIGFEPKEIKYMQSHFAMELAVKNGRGISLCGENICDHFREGIKLYHVRKPYQEQFVIAAWRENNENMLARAFVDTIGECSGISEQSAIS